MLHRASIQEGINGPVTTLNIVDDDHDDINTDSIVQLLSATGRMTINGMFWFSYTGSVTWLIWCIISPSKILMLPGQTSDVSFKQQCIYLLSCRNPILSHRSNLATMCYTCLLF